MVLFGVVVGLLKDQLAQVFDALISNYKPSEISADTLENTFYLINNTIM